MTPTVAHARVPGRLRRWQPARKPRPPLPAVLAGAYLALVALAALAPAVLATAPPQEIDPVRGLRPPSGQHWFGTDELGRDVYSRVVHGARSSLYIGLGATGIGVLAGGLFGFAAAWGGRVVDQVLMRAVDVLLAFPSLLLALLAIAVLGPGTANVVVAVGVAAIPEYARLVRARALSVRAADYVEASGVLGAGPLRTWCTHVVPNALWPLLVRVTLGIGTAVLAGAALSFLGLGPPPPAAEWGAMVAEGQEFLAHAWWVVLFPGAVTTATVVALTVLGRALRNRWEATGGS